MLTGTYYDTRDAMASDMCLATTLLRTRQIPMGVGSIFTTLLVFLYSPSCERLAPGVKITTGRATPILCYEPTLSDTR